MAGINIMKAIQEAQLKIAEYGVAEAKAKKEKAEVELETARLQQRGILKLIESDNSACLRNNGRMEKRGGRS